MGMLSLLVVSLDLTRHEWMIADVCSDPNLYYHGGDVRMARFFSRFVALQIQADVLGRPMEPYLE